MDFRQLWRRLRHPRNAAAPLPPQIAPAAHAAAQIEHYLRNGRRPWSRGYHQYKDAFIRQRLDDADFLARLRRGEQLPPGYGEFLDERVVEYPWLFSRLSAGRGRLLDAGSILNLPHIITQPALAHRQTTIVTLAPEKHCFWQQAVGYVFGDVRELPFRDGWFDDIVCLSTLEHVGKDNTRVGYTADARLNENNAEDFLVAAMDLKRVCKPGGRVLVSVPYGRFTDFGWYQQFDARLIGKLIEAFAPARLEQTYFRYTGGGWNIAEAEECADCEGFDIHATRYKNPQSTKDYDPDFAACSRAVAALELFV
jgi:SAM-dependent methyltransferase